MTEASKGVVGAIDVTLTIGLDTIMGDQIEYDEDGDPYSVGNITFADVIAQKAAVLVADSYREEIRRAPNYILNPVEVAKAAIDAEVTKVVADTLQRVTVETDSFGTPKAEPKTIAEILQGRVDAWLKESSKTDSYGRRTAGPSNLDALLDAAIGHDVTQQIKKATLDAKNEVLADLKASQKAALTAAVESILKSA